MTTAPVFQGNEPTRSYDEGGNWISLSTPELWDAVFRSGGEAHVGLRSPARRRGMYHGARLLSHSDEAIGQRAVIAVPGVSLISTYEQLPLLRVRISTPDALTRLRGLPFVDYIEPARLPQEEGFAAEATMLSSSGCGYPGWSDNGMHLTPGDYVSDRYFQVGIVDAWRRARGDGVVIGVIDTGVSQFQHDLLTQFSSGLSAPRVTIRYGTKPALLFPNPDWHASCSHGSRMAGLIAAPRNGSGTVGVAYESDLISVRFTDGVIDVDAGEAIKAIHFVGAHSGFSARRIVPMAWRSSPSGALSDVIDSYHYQHGVLFLGAVGQSICVNPFRGVAWPARKAAVIAVGGVEDNNVLPCHVHRGPETEIVGLILNPAEHLYS